MIQSEKNFWQLCKRNFAGHYDRIETVVGSGFPDVIGARDEKNVLIELKVAHGKWIHFRASQLAWYRQYHTQASNVVMLARAEDVIFIVPMETIILLPGHLYKPKYVKYAVETLWEVMPCGYGFTKPWDWKAIETDLYTAV